MWGAEGGTQILCQWELPDCKQGCPWISNATVSRIVNTVTLALATLSPNYVRFPSDDGSINDTILGFSHISNFLNVIGAIDGTHISIKTPKDDEHIFVNRKKSLYKRYGSL